MAEVEVIDLVQGSQVEQTGEGFLATRRALVTGLTGNPEAKIFNALTAPGIPVKGEFHPVIPNLQVVRKTAIPVDSGNVNVTIQYKKSTFVLNVPSDTAPPEIRVGASLQEVETNLDVNDQPITLDHTFISVDENGNEVERVGETQGGLVRVQIPQVIFSFQRREPNDPSTKALNYIGAVNSITFRGQPAKRWLCTRIDGFSDNNQESFLVNYEFIRRVPDWDATVVYTDPDTQNPVPDPVDGVGIKTVQIYPEADFNQLNLGV